MKLAISLFICVIILTNLCPVILGQEQTASSEDAKTVKPDLITLQGMVQKEDGAEKVMKSGWGCFAKPAEILTFHVSPVKELDEEIRVDPYHSLDVSRKYRVRKDITREWDVSSGGVKRFIRNGMIWNAPPSPGSCKISVLHRDETSYVMTAPTEKRLDGQNIIGTFVFHVLVKYPFDRTGPGVIEGYPIGIYPDEKGDDVKAPVTHYPEKYSPPDSFIKVTPENAAVKISEHFTPGDFAPPFQETDVHFIAVDMQLVKRLERIIDELQNEGVEVSDLSIIRAYLTPIRAERYRQQGIEIARFSRLIYGDSAFFIVDEDDNGLMDDLTGDGRLDQDDFLLVEKVGERSECEAGR